MTHSLSEFWNELVACSDDLALLLELIARRAAEVVGEASLLATVSDDGKELETVAVHHLDPEVSSFIWAVMGSAPYPIGEGLAGNAALHRQPVIVSNVGADGLSEMLTTHAAEFMERHTIHAVLIVPMIAFGEVVGTLGVARIQRDEPYAAEDLMVLEALAERAALAIASATRRPGRVGPVEYEAIFMQGIDGVLFTSPDGRILAANPAACEILQRSEVDICRLGRDGLLDIDDPNAKRAIAQRAVSGKLRADLRMIRGNGERFIADISSTIFATDDGELRATVIFRDMTDRVHAEEQLATQHRYLELLHDVTTTINETADVDAAIEYALHYIGTATDWLLGDALLASDDGALVPTSAWFVAEPARFRWFRRGTPRTVLPPGAGLAGHVVRSAAALWVSDLALDWPEVRDATFGDVPLRGYVGVPITAGTVVRGVLEVFSDQPKPRDDQLLRVMTDLGSQLGRALERSENEVTRRRVEADRGAFVARAAHELRSPVAALNISADLLADNFRDAALAEKLVGLVVDGAHHLARLVKRLLDLSEIERGTPMLKIERVDIGLIVDRALGSEPAPPGHTVTRNVAPETWALVDALSLEQVLTNLLGNAFRHGGQHVDITAQPEGDRLLLSVADDGPGVDPAIEAKLFEPFVRGPSELGDGAGLGLAVSRRLVEAMGGTLRYERNHGTGCRFVIDIPGAA